MREDPEISYSSELELILEGASCENGVHLFSYHLTFTLHLCNNPTAMIPIHYFLALLAVLVSLMGCTQKAPPGSVQPSTFNNNAFMNKSTAPVATTEEPVQLPRRDRDSNVKPFAEPAPTTVELSQPNGAHHWKLVVKGADAEKLYKVMAIKPNSKTDHDHRDLNAVVKSGTHLECYSLDQGGHQCELILEGDTGELKILNKKIASFKADEVLTDLYHSNLMDVNSANTGGKISFSAESQTQEEAQKIFEGMSKVKPIELAADDINDVGYQKKGVNVDCYQQFKKAKPSEPLYTCNFWFLNSTTGEFDKIK